MKKEIISTIDCTPDWEPIIRHALGWIKDATKYEKDYREGCTDYDGAMKSYCSLILDCAKGLDMMNKRMPKESEAA